MYNYYSKIRIHWKLYRRKIKVEFWDRVRRKNKSDFGNSTISNDSPTLETTNRQFFLRKQKECSENQLLSSPNYLSQASHRKTIKGRILVIDDRIPHCYLGSGFPRANFILNTMIGLGYHVYFFSMFPIQELWDEIYKDISTEVEIIQEHEAYNLEKLLANRLDEFDIIFISRPHNMFTFRCLSISKKALEKKKIIYDAEALFTERTFALEHLQGKKVSKKKQIKMLKQEVSLTLGTSAIVSVSQSEAQKFSQFGYPRQNIYVIGHAKKPCPTATDFSERKNILFVGSIHHLDSPNADSVMWFTRMILPIIHQKFDPSIKFIVAGFNEVEEIYQLTNYSVQILGRVEDLTPLYDTSQIFVAPTRFSAGIPLKVYDAAANGLPSVTTSQIATQLGWDNGIELLVADEAENFADLCIELYQNSTLWHKIRQNALERISYDCSPTTISKTLDNLLQANTANDLL